MAGADCTLVLEAIGPSPRCRRVLGPQNLPTAGGCWEAQRSGAFYSEHFYVLPLPTTPVIGFRTHPRSRVTSSRGPLLVSPAKTLVPNEVTSRESVYEFWGALFDPLQSLKYLTSIQATPLHEARFKAPPLPPGCRLDAQSRAAREAPRGALRFPP